MIDKQIQVFSKSEVDLLLDIYDARDYSIDEHMSIYGVGDNDTVKLLIEEKITPHIPDDYEVMWDCSHYYSHEHSYFLHTDFQPQWVESINVVIPLKNDNPSSLIVFDQRWRQWPMTWFFDYPLIHIPTNPAIKGAPYEYPIENKTDKHIDAEFYNKYLAESWGSEKDYHSLSGNAYEHISGSAIIFDASKIHGTSKMSGSKTGLTVRYKLKQ